MDRIEEFCRKWNVRELSLFGSILRDDYRPDSDVDMLFDFEPHARRTLLDLVAMREELCDLLGRPVDLISRKGVERSGNTARRDAILSSARVLYAA